MAALPTWQDILSRSYDYGSTDYRKLARKQAAAADSGSGSSSSNYSWAGTPTGGTPSAWTSDWAEGQYNRLGNQQNVAEAAGIWDQIKDVGTESMGGLLDTAGKLLDFTGATTRGLGTGIAHQIGTGLEAIGVDNPLDEWTADPFYESINQGDDNQQGTEGLGAFLDDTLGRAVRGATNAADYGIGDFDQGFLAYQDDDNALERTGKALGTFALDTISDPLTYVTFGAGAAGKAVVAGGIKLAARNTVSGLADEAVRPIAQRSSLAGSLRSAIDAGDVEAEAAAKRMAEIVGDTRKVTAKDAEELFESPAMQRHFAERALTEEAGNAYTRYSARGLRRYLLEDSGLADDAAQSFMTQLGPGARGGARFAIPFTEFQSGAVLSPSLLDKFGAGKVADKASEGALWAKTLKPVQAARSRMSGETGKGWSEYLGKLQRGEDTSFWDLSAYRHIGLDRRGYESRLNEEGKHRLGSVFAATGQKTKQGQAAAIKASERFLANDIMELPDDADEITKGGFAVAQAVRSTFESILNDMRDEGIELNEINDYIFRAVTDEYKKFKLKEKSPRGGRGTGTGGQDVTKSREAFQKLTGVDAEGNAVTRWESLAEANKAMTDEGLPPIFETDPTKFLSQYLLSTNRLRAAHRLDRSLREAGLVMPLSRETVKRLDRDKTAEALKTAKATLDAERQAIRAGWERQLDTPEELPLDTVEPVTVTPFAEVQESVRLFEAMSPAERGVSLDEAAGMTPAELDAKYGVTRDWVYEPFIPDAPELLDELEEASNRVDMLGAASDSQDDIVFAMEENDRIYSKVIQAIRNAGISADDADDFLLEESIQYKYGIPRDRVQAVRATVNAADMAYDEVAVAAKALSPAEFETAAVLAQGWESSLDDLVSAAKSLTGDDYKYVPSPERQAYEAARNAYEMRATAAPAVSRAPKIDPAMSAADAALAGREQALNGLEEQLAAVLGDDNNLLSYVRQMSEKTPEEQAALVDDLVQVLSSIGALQSKNMLDTAAQLEARGSTKAATRARQKAAEALAVSTDTLTSKTERQAASVAAFADMERFGDPNAKGTVAEFTGLPRNWEDDTLVAASIRSMLEQHFTVRPSRKFVDEVFAPYLTFWKLSATVGRGPGYVARNASGAAWNNFVIGVRIRNWRDARKISRAQYAATVAADKDIAAYAGDAAAWETAYRKAFAEKVNGDEKLIAADIAWGESGMGRNNFNLDTLGNNLSTAAASGGQMVDDVVRGGKTRATRGAPINVFRQAPGELNRFERGVNKAANNPLYKTGSTASQAVETEVRLAAFMRGIDVYGLENGWQNASSLVKASQFDYADLSPFERDVVRMLVPFYTWVRNNVPLQYRVLINDPRKVVGAVRAQEELKSAFGYDYENNPDALPYDEMAPGYVRDKMGFTIDPKWVPDVLETNGQPMSFQMDLPLNDLSTFIPKDPTDVGAWLQKGGTQGSSALNPFIKTAMAAIQQRDLSTGSSWNDRGMPATAWAQALGKVPVLGDIIMESPDVKADGTVEQRMNPLIGTAVRDLLPTVGLGERLYTGPGAGQASLDRASSNWLSFFGLPVRTPTEEQLGGTAMTIATARQKALEGTLVERGIDVNALKDFMSKATPETRDYWIGQARTMLANGAFRMAPQP